MIVGDDENMATGWMSGPSAAVNDSVSRCRRTACRCLVVTQKIALHGLGDAGRQVVAEKRPGAPRLGEQLVGKTIAPQGEIGKVHCGSSHVNPACSLPRDTRLAPR